MAHIHLGKPGTPYKVGISGAADLAGTSRVAVATAVTNGELPREVENGKAKFEPEVVQAWAQKRQETHQERWERQAKEARAKLRQDAQRLNDAAGGGYASQVAAGRANSEASVRRLEERRADQIAAALPVPTPASQAHDALVAQVAALQARLDALEAERK